eukprot:12230010-Karenia_brevis.AAC.1
MTTLKAFAKACAVRNNSTPKHVLSLQLQKLCTIVRRARARAVLRRVDELQDQGGGLAGEALIELECA